MAGYISAVSAAECAAASRRGEAERHYGNTSCCYYPGKDSVISLAWLELRFCHHVIFSFGRETT